MSVSRRKSSGKSKPGRRVGLSIAEEARLRQRLGRVVCSEPWLDAQFPTFTDTDEQGEEITYRFHDPKVFPPGGSQTRMVRCARCGRWTPPVAMEGGECLDHRESDGWGPSPSAMGIQRLQMRQARKFDRMLPSESPRALRREIEAFEERKGQRSEKPRDNA